MTNQHSLGRCALVLTLMLPAMSMAKNDRRRLYPKMIGRGTPAKAKALFTQPDVSEEVTDSTAAHVSSSSAIHQGACASTGEFRFRLGGGQGVGFAAGVDIAQGLTSDDSSSIFDVVNATAESGIFGAIGPSLQFFYRNVPANGTDVVLSCSTTTTARGGVLVIVRDTNPTSKAIEIDGDFTLASGESRLHLNQKAASVLSVEARQNLLWTDETGSVRKLKEKSLGVLTSDLLEWSAEGTNAGELSDLSVKTAQSHDIVFATFDFVDESSGFHVPRTVIFETPEQVPTIQTFAMAEIDVNEDGDVDILFNASFAESKTVSDYLVTARVALVPTDTANSTDAIGVAEYSSIIDPQSGHLVVHGAWIRNAADKLSNLDEYRVDIVEAIFQDPNDGYRTVAVLEKAQHGARPIALTHGNHRKLHERPETEIPGEVTEDMLLGRRPKLEPSSTRRALQTKKRKILVHGYCSPSNPFPTSHFSNKEVFYGGKKNWSHHRFATELYTFTRNRGITDCNMIGHSQGGAAALHLLTYFWSCLDTSTSARPIQSVGTPYLGTALAGNLALIGDIFGVGCGKNDDMTHSGASKWVSGIPVWAREKVYYHTTSFKDKSFRWDYCHIAADLVLNDPDDGTVQRDKGRLTGGNNMGHKTGWWYVYFHR